MNSSMCSLFISIPLEYWMKGEHYKTWNVVYFSCRTAIDLLTYWLVVVAFLHVTFEKNKNSRNFIMNSDYVVDDDDIKNERAKWFCNQSQSHLSKSTRITNQTYQMSYQCERVGRWKLLTCATKDVHFELRTESEYFYAFTHSPTREIIKYSIFLKRLIFELVCGRNAWAG